MYRIILAGCVALALGACAAFSTGTAPPSPGERVVEPPSDELGALYYHLLVAEMAVRQNDLGLTLDSYVQAMRLTDDPRVAEQAARHALHAGADAQGTEAAARWLELAPDDVEAHRHAGLFALRGNDFDAALVHFRRVLEDQEVGPEEAFARLGVALTQVPDRRAALGVLERLVAERPAEAHAHYVLAQFALHAGEPDYALRAVRRSLLLQPGWRAPQMLMIRIQLVQGDTEAALALLESVLEARPDDYELRLYYARTLLDMNRPESALSQFELLLQERPDDAQVLYGSALLALELGHLDEAREHLLSLVNQGERLGDAYYYLGRLAEMEGDQRGAVRWYDEVAGARRQDAQFRASLVLATLDEVDAARQRLLRLRAQHPEAVTRSYVMEAELLRLAARPQQALEVLDQALAAHPRTTDFLYSRALLNVELERLDAAERDLREVLVQRPDHAHALNALGYTLVDRTQRYREGYEFIRKAYELKPDNVAIIDSLGWAYYRLGDLDNALKYLSLAYQRSSDPEIAAHLAEVLWHLGEHDDAEQVLEEALEQSPEHPVLTDTRRRLYR